MGIMKTILSAFIVLTFAFITYAGELENAREAKGKTVIKCSPDGKNGGLILLRAIDQLKRGSELIILPGSYDSTINIDEDRVIISGDGSGKKANVSINLTGKDCIVRNLWANNVTAVNDCIVVDSIISDFSTGYSGKGKVKSAMYNTGLCSINTDYRDIRMKIENCTFISEGTILDCEQNTRWTITNSIFYSNQSVFRFDGYGRKKAKLSLKDNLIFGKTALGIKEYVDSGSDKSSASSLKELKKLASVTLKGKNIVEKPEFAEPVTFIGDHAFYSWRMSPKYLMQKPDSPGKGKGIDINENIIFKQQKPAEVKINPPNNQNKQNGLGGVPVLPK